MDLTQYKLMNKIAVNAIRSKVVWELVLGEKWTEKEAVEEKCGICRQNV